MTASLAVVLLFAVLAAFQYFLKWWQWGICLLLLLAVTLLRAAYKTWAKERRMRKSAYIEVLAGQAERAKEYLQWMLEEYRDEDSRPSIEFPARNTEAISQLEKDRIRLARMLVECCQLSRWCLKNTAFGESELMQLQSASDFKDRGFWAVNRETLVRLVRGHVDFLSSAMNRVHTEDQAWERK